MVFLQPDEDPFMLAGVEGATVIWATAIHVGKLLPQLFTALTQTSPPENVEPKFNEISSVVEEPVTPAGNVQL